MAEQLVAIADGTRERGFDVARIYGGVALSVGRADTLARARLWAAAGDLLEAARDLIAAGLPCTCTGTDRAVVGGSCSACRLEDAVVRATGGGA